LCPPPSLNVFIRLGAAARLTGSKKQHAFASSLESVDELPEPSEMSTWNWHAGEFVVPEMRLFRHNYYLYT